MSSFQFLFCLLFFSEHFQIGEPGRGIPDDTFEQHAEMLCHPGDSRRLKDVGVVGPRACQLPVPFRHPKS